MKRRSISRRATSTSTTATTRSRTPRNTISDQPGKDAEVAVRQRDATFMQPKTFLIEAIVSHADPISSTATTKTDVRRFRSERRSSTDLYRRDWTTSSAEFASFRTTRPLFADSTDCRRRYTLKQDEQLHRVYTFITPDFTSAFRIQRGAVQQTETHLSDATNLTVGCVWSVTTRTTTTSTARNSSRTTTCGADALRCRT